VSVGTIVSLVIGAWGAVVATVLGVRELRRDKRRVHVECETRWGKMPVDTRGFGKFSSTALQDELFVRVRVQNLGQRPVEPRHVFFLTRTGRRSIRPFDVCTAGQMGSDGPIGKTRRSAFGTGQRRD